jgi:hypothetical protein
MSETTALTVYEPNSISEALSLAKVLVESRLLPKSITTAQQAFTIMAAGKEMGLTAMQALRSIHVIEGKPSCSADLILALCKRHQDVCLYFRLVRSDAAAATYETRRRGDPEPTTLSFTIEQARAAKLTGKDNWSKYPEAMLRARCIAALARAVYPDLVLGVYETDELAPVERAINVAPVRGIVSDDPPESYDPVTGEVLEAATQGTPLPAGSPAPAGDRLQAELAATALVARIARIANEFERDAAGGCVMAGVNRVTIIGNLGKDPETKFRRRQGGVQVLCRGE